MFGTEEEQKQIVTELQQYPCCQRCILRFLGYTIPAEFKGCRPSEIIREILHRESVTENVPSSDPTPTESMEDPAMEDPPTKDPATDDTDNENGCDVMSCDSITPVSISTQFAPPKNTEDLMDVADKETDLDGTKAKQKEQTNLCISCLGILQDNCTTMFVEKVVIAVQEADHTFDSFLFSISLSVQFILRQHTIWKYLKQTYGSVYKAHRLDELPTIKDVFKWIFGPKLSSQLDVRFSPSSLYEIMLSVNHFRTSGECNFLIPIGKLCREPQQKRRRKVQNFDGVSRSSVHKKLTEMSAEELQKHYPWPPSSPKTECTIGVTSTHRPIFVAGRYNKYSRTLSQTPWFIDGVRKTPNSVEEYICNPIRKELQAQDHKFSSSGREDVDVLTLGRGRPFLVEVLNPHRAIQGQDDMRTLQEVINSSTQDIAVNDLQIVTKEETKLLKDGEMIKTKSYNAIIWVAEPMKAENLKILETFKDLVLYQKTPIRVLHRRNLATRERVVHSMHAEYIDDHHFHLNLNTQAGTYIKEFVHSDFGRTEPNLGDLLKCHVDIVELDVASVDLDWPRKLDTSSETKAI